ncbi:hypothetical protein RND71_012478 [Anisodus tanguticus]|uniref:Uncharacterized protein n=1 Tax=Anisodus tanguticus TaxID=243964 RepID=A0AAE1SFB7_9SOLA|nr:hypothetical protein RND71_012478 [Anisodus tanguticus]
MKSLKLSSLSSIPFWKWQGLVLLAFYRWFPIQFGGSKLKNQAFPLTLGFLQTSHTTLDAFYLVADTTLFTSLDPRG